MKKQLFVLTLTLVSLSLTTLSYASNEIPASSQSTITDDTRLSITTNPNIPQEPNESEENSLARILTSIPSYKAERTAAGAYHFRLINVLRTDGIFPHADAVKENADDIKYDAEETETNEIRIAIIVNEPHTTNPVPAALLIHNARHDGNEVVDAFMQVRLMHQAATQLNDSDNQL